MATSIFDRIQELRESFSDSTQQHETVTLDTQTVKISLGLYLLQSVFIATIWATRDKIPIVWLIPVATFLQIGWVWNKVTKSWKEENIHTTPLFSKQDESNV